MSDKELEIFELCERLAELLGDKEAITDLQTLLERHPEMFQNKEQVANLIKKVINDPEIIINNPTPKSEKDYIAGRKLNEKKMGEVGIRKDEDISKIFHANEKRLKNLELMAKKDVVADGRDAHTPYTQAQSLDGRLVQKNISSTTNSIVPQNKDKANQKRIKEFTRLNNKNNLLQVETPTPSTHQLNGLELMDKDPSGANALSATNDNIIPHNKDKTQIGQSSLDSLNERFTQALEEHKQNQRERYSNPQGQDNNSDSTESKKSYKRR